MTEVSKSGVLLNESFRDSLIIDKYDPIFHSSRRLKLEHIRSENSEDAMTWNTFRSLNQMKPELWLPSLFEKSFGDTFSYPVNAVNMSLWGKLPPPLSLHVKEGHTEFDVMIESEAFVWIIEAKYKSDISMGTTNDPTRNQVIRNIDVGLEYAKNKDFYFSLLILEDQKSRKGAAVINQYRQLLDKGEMKLTFRKNAVNLKGIGLLTWFDLLEVLEKIKDEATCDFERFVAARANDWLGNKIQSNEDSR